MRSEAPACRVRPMKSGDIRQVMEIERQSFPSIWSRTIYERELKNKLARYLVAYQPLDDSAPAPPEPGIVGFVRRVLRREPLTRERILGLVGLWCMTGGGRRGNIGGRAGDRRQGRGEGRVGAIVEAAWEAGQDGVALEYRASNHEARALYEKYGFSQVGVRARYYSDNQEDAVLLSTPPLRSSVYQKLIARCVAEQQSRWGESYPLTGALTRLVTPLASG